MDAAYIGEFFSYVDIIFVIIFFQVNPVMTCYKLVTIEFKWFGLQSKVESFLSSFQQRIFLNFHRQLFCWTDKWHGMTMEDIRALEDKTKEELEQQRQSKETRGTKPI